MSFLEDQIAIIEDLIRRPFSSFYRIETSIDAYTLVSSEGAMCTMLRLDGLPKISSINSNRETTENLLSKISSGFTKQGHAIEFCFTRDPDRSRAEIKRQVIPVQQAAKRLGLDIDDLLEERVSYLSDFVAWESAVFVIWTLPSALGKDELKIAREKSEKERKNLPSRRSGQDYLRGFTAVLQKHKGFVDLFATSLVSVGLRVKKLKVHTSIAYQKDVLYPSSVDVNAIERFEDSNKNLSESGTWRPYLPGDKIPMRAKLGPPDIGDITWPKLQRQIFRSGVSFDEEYPQYPIIETNAYACVDVDLPPEKIPASGFQDLMNSIIRSTDEHGRPMPFRVRYLIETAGMFKLAFKQMIAQVTAYFSESGKRINNAVKYLREITNSSDPGIVDKAVSLRISSCTWAPKGNWDLLRTREAAIKSAFEQWGGCHVTTAFGDPLEAFVSSVPGMDIASTATLAVSPLRDILAMIPFDRPAPPIQDGLVLFRSEDGKLFPHSPGRKSQMVVQLVCGQPGAGKSVLLNMLNFATVLSQKTVGVARPRLPRIAIIDIGPSSSGFISIIKNSLPPDRQHEAVFYQMRMAKEDAINPLDTQLGCRKPTPLERSFIENFVGLIVTSIETGHPYDGMGGLITAAIDAAYKYRDPESPGSQPHIYKAGYVKEVDEAIRHHRIEIPSDIYWWELVDKLFEHGAFYEAELAQVYAVPTLEDLAAVVSTPEIKQRYDNTKTPSGERMTDAFTRMIAQTLSGFPILSERTRLRFAGSRIISLDLQNVAGRTNLPQDARKTAVSYMLARKVLAGDFYVTAEEVSLFPEMYRPYHQKRIIEMREQPKRLHFDEFHRTGTSPQVRSQVIIDIREGRKYDVEIALASQDIDDFDPTMMEFSTELYVMGKGAGNMPDRIAERFKLSTPTKLAMIQQLQPPSRAGASAVVKLILEDGDYEQFVRVTTGPIELWAYSTRQEDAEIRRRLYEMIGPREARQMLAKHYRGGSAKAEIELLKEQQMRSGLANDDAELGAIDSIVRKLVDDYRKTAAAKG